MKENHINNFTKCHINKVLTIKMKNKLWILFLFAVPLHCQLAENTQ